MTFKTTITAAAAVGLMSVGLSGFAKAEEEDKGFLPGEFSATTTFATNYLFRGITQTDDKPAVQGSFDWSYDKLPAGFGVYAGVWGSNIDFDLPSPPGGDGPIEVDYYAGLTKSLSVLDFDGGFIFYSYPGAAKALDFDYWEFQLTTALNYEPVTKYVQPSVGVYYSPDFFGGVDQAWYVSGDVTVPITAHMKDVPFDLALVAHVGRQEFVNETLAGKGYTETNFGAVATVEGFDLDLRYYTNTLGASGDEQVVFSVSRGF